MPLFQGNHENMLDASASEKDKSSLNEFLFKGINFIELLDT